MKVPPILRLPKAGTRCHYTGLSRTSLSELVTPTARNGGKPPVRAICQRAHRHAQRGIWLIPAETLFRYLLRLGTPPTGDNQGVSSPHAACYEDHIAKLHTVRPSTGPGNIHLN